jgi:uncharacterized membrane protein
MNKSIVRNLMLWVMVVFYVFGGYNHFKNPSFYIPLIPPYLASWAVEINILSGVFEILLGILMIPKQTRKLAGWGIILMLIAFIPSHIYFIERGTFALGSLTMSPVVSWIRLLVMQPLLILWAWWVSKPSDVKS